MYTYKYQFNINGYYEDLANALAVFVEGRKSGLTEDAKFEVDTIRWGNVVGGSPDEQEATVTVLFEKALGANYDAFVEEYDKLVITSKLV